MKKVITKILICLFLGFGSLAAGPNNFFKVKDFDIGIMKLPYTNYGIVSELSLESKFALQLKYLKADEGYFSLSTEKKLPFNNYHLGSLSIGWIPFDSRFKVGVFAEYLRIKGKHRGKLIETQNEPEKDFCLISCGNLEKIHYFQELDFNNNGFGVSLNLGVNFWRIGISSITGWSIVDSRQIRYTSLMLDFNIF